MTIELIKMKDDPKRMNKDTSNVIAVESNVQPFMPLDMLNPVFMLEYKPEYLATNYCWIELFNRYYFVEPPVLLTGNRMQITCHVDVLTSNANAVSNKKFYITRCENHRNARLVDPDFPIAQGYQEEIVLFPDTPLKGYGEANTRVLEVMGGAV